MGGHEIPLWGTFKQWPMKGGKVRKGEKGTLGASHEPRDDHAKYLNNWMQVLKGDMRAFTSAASKAQQAAGYLMRLQVQRAAA